MSDIRTHILRSEADFRALRPEWSELHARASGTIFQTHEWLERWWRVYGTGDGDLRVFTVRIDGRLGAVLPLYLDRVRFPGIRLGFLRFIGIYEAYGEYSILADPDRADDCARAIATALAECLNEPGTDLVYLFRFPPDSGPMRTLVTRMGELGSRVRFRPEVVPRVMMELPETWDQYLESLPRNERQGIPRKMRALGKKGAEIEIVSAPDETAFADYVRLHGESWRPRGVKGYFHSPRFTKFLGETTISMMNGGRSRLYFLTKDGKRFCAVHAFYCNRICCFYLSGLDRNHELVPMSPGKILLTHVIRDAIAEGFRVFDFQGGDEDYKLRLGGRKTFFAKAIFWKGGVRSSRVMLFLILQALYQEVFVTFMIRGVPKLKSLLRRRPRGG